MKISFGLYPDVPASEVVRLGTLADKLGYHTVWVCDSHLLWREAYVTLGALAARTTRARLGTAVTNPITRRLSVTASAVATLDELSGGRAVLGISVGDSALRTEGLEPATVAAFERAVDLVRRMMAGQEVAVPDGGRPRITFGRRPMPIYVAATGPRMLDLAGRIADGVILMNGVVPDLIAPAIDAVAAGARAAGRNPADVKAVVWAACSASATAPDDARQAVKYNVARAILRRMPGPADSRVEEVAAALRQHYDYYQHGSASAEFARLVPDDLVGRFAFAGTPEEVRSQVDALEEAGVDEVALAVPHVPGVVEREAVIRGLASMTSAGQPA